jgi:hypothetical protein
MILINPTGSKNIPLHYKNMKLLGFFKELRDK